MRIEAYSCFTAQPFVANPAAFGPAIPLSQSMTGAMSIVSTNDMDTKANPFRDLAAGPLPIYIVIGVSTTFAGVGNQGMTVSMQQSANPGAGPYTFLDQLGVFPALAAPPVSLVGPQTSMIVDQLQPYLVTQRYLSLVFTMSGAVLTAGAVYAFLTPDPTLAYNPPVNYTVATK